MVLDKTRTIFCIVDIIGNRRRVIDYFSESAGDVCCLEHASGVVPVFYCCPVLLYSLSVKMYLFSFSILFKKLCNHCSQHDQYDQ